MNWRDFLTGAERDRYDAIPSERKALTAEARLIYGRCLKRMERHKNGKHSGKQAM